MLFKPDAKHLEDTYVQDRRPFLSLEKRLELTSFGTMMDIIEKSIKALLISIKRCSWTKLFFLLL